MYFLHFSPEGAREAVRFSSRALAGRCETVQTRSFVDLVNNKVIHVGMSFQLPSNHYRLSSQSYGGFSFDSIGRANSQGASTVDDPTSAPLNGPPSAVFLPHGAGKTVGQNGRTLAFPGQYTFGQTRANDQKVQWVPARPTSLANGATGINSSLAYKAVAPTWDLTELFRQVRDVKLHRQWHCNSPLSTITRLALTSIRTHTYTYAHIRTRTHTHARRTQEHALASLRTSLAACSLTLTTTAT